MADKCCATENKVMILPCSGASNVGQLANQAAVELTQEGYGDMFCLAGIGGQFEDFVVAACMAKRMVVIDGCSLGCARATLEQAKVPLKDYVVLTDLGIEKNKDFNLRPEDIRRVKEAVKAAVGKRTIQVYDPPLCCSTGVCGPNVDQKLVRFAADLDWLRRQGIGVERYNLAQQPGAFAQNAMVSKALTELGNECLPLVIREGEIVCSGRYPSRKELAAMAGIPREAVDEGPVESPSRTLPMAGAAGCCPASTSVQHTKEGGA